MHEQLYACERDILSFMYAKPHDEVFTVEDFDEGRISCRTENHA